MLLTSGVLLLLAVARRSTAECFDPSPAFPPPLWENGAEDLAHAFQHISRRLSKLVKAEQYDTSSFSIQVTSNTETLWSYYHSAKKHDPKRPGVTDVDGDSQYRIASITKTFTVLGLLYQAAAGSISLDDPVSQYIAELAGPDSGKLPWKDITLRALASQLSGIPHDMIAADLLNDLPDPTVVGLPPADNDNLPSCRRFSNEEPCSRKQVLDHLKKRKPIFAPNAIAEYSNANYDLLGMVLSNVTGLPYEAYMQKAIFDPLKLSSTTFHTPPDAHAVLPVGQNFWNVEMAIENPGGGMYSSANDLTKYVRYILTHFNTLATGVNWLLPYSWSGSSMNSLYGMPWEIYRTDKLLHHTKRAVTFVTKGGSVPFYRSEINIMSDYGLGLTILVGGNAALLALIREIITVELIRAAEAEIWKSISHSHAGTYVSISSSLNSSVSFSASASRGLVLESFISNNTNVFTTILPRWAGAFTDRPWRAQLMPTLLYKDEKKQKGEIWRIMIATERTKKDEKEVWSESCNTVVDPVSYAGLPLNEVVFWLDEQEVELPAWKVKMKKTSSHDEERMLRVQT